MTTSTTRVTRTSPIAAAARFPRSRTARPGRSVEEMLEEISLVLWLTKKVKDEILADAAPVRDTRMTDADVDMAACV